MVLILGKYLVLVARLTNGIWGATTTEQCPPVRTHCARTTQTQMETLS